LRPRWPDLPKPEIMTVRLVLQLAHELELMLEHHTRPFGLGHGDFRVLTALHSQPDGAAFPSDLCAQAWQSPANLSRISDNLVKRELITRAPSARDRRRTLLRMTAKGEQLVSNLLPRLFGPLREACKENLPQEQAQLIALLQGLLIRLELRPGTGRPAV
jgi:DNA-binding MarR family transcriptional regulator